jgi:hypothetical protein
VNNLSQIDIRSVCGRNALQPLSGPCPTLGVVGDAQPTDRGFRTASKGWRVNRRSTALGEMSQTS